MTSGGSAVLAVMKQMWAVRGPLVTAMVLLLALPLVLMVDGLEARTAYVLLVMAVMWLTEAIPIPVTSLMPIVLFPALGVAPAKDISKNYINDTSMLFMGGLIVAVAVEEWNLHKRIALGVLTFVGSDPKFIMAGLMMPTWFLSMWISNTATASMMIPILQAVLQQLKPPAPNQDNADEDDDEIAPLEEQDGQKSGSKMHSEMTKLTTIEAGCDITRPTNHRSTGRLMAVDDDVPTEDGLRDRCTARPSATRLLDSEYARLCKGLSLCIAYSANVGGIATLTGSPPNLVLKGQADLLFERYGGDSGINFANFMMMALPLSVLMLVICWLWLFILYIRCNHCCHQDPDRKAAVTKTIRDEFKAMGSITFAECVIVVLFLMFAVMLLTRSSTSFSGWGTWFPAGYVSDSSSAMFISILLFLLPAKKPSVFCWGYTDSGVKQKPTYTPLLKWPMVHAKLPWGVIILLGGGFALADACKKSGLSEMVGRNLESFRDMDPLLSNLLFALVVAMATEVTSNTATATLLLPIVAELSLKVGANPLFLMMTTALATSFAFMLPVATPPNAIVFSHGHLKIHDMAVAGLMMNAIAVLCLILCMSTWATSIFSLDTLPDVFKTNTTGTTANITS